MGKWKIYTPEGVKDQLPNNCYLKRNLEGTLRQFFLGYGFDEIETPVIEFYDTFYLTMNSMKQEEMFKLIDSRGRLLVLRPDMTIPTARMVATKMADRTTPQQYFYIGDCFRFNEAGGGRLNEFTQLGCEMLGANGPKADAQLIVTAIQALLETGLTDFQIDIGQVEFFKGLMAKAGIVGDELEEIRKLIDSKDFIGLKLILDQTDMDDEIKKIALNLPSLFGSFDILDRLESLDLNEMSRNALKNLREIMSVIDNFGFAKYVSIDLGMVPSLDYYTGIIFKGFTHSVGFPIISGGRYDNLVEEFGKSMSATGFSIGINMVMDAIQRQKIVTENPVVDVFVIYNEESGKAAFEYANTLRDEGMRVRMDISNFDREQAIKYCKANDITSLCDVQSADRIVMTNVKTNKEEVL